MRLILLFVSAVIAAMLPSCVLCTDPDEKELLVYNESDRHIFVAASYEYPDTIYHINENVGWVVPPHAYHHAQEFYKVSENGSFYKKTEMVQLFVVPIDTATGTVHEDTILARYAFNEKMMKKAGWRIVFPHDKFN